MREVLSTQLRGCSAVLQVAHNLDALRDYDRVAVMANGTIVEAGMPAALLANPSSRLSELAAHAPGARGDTVTER